MLEIRNLTKSYGNQMIFSSASVSFPSTGMIGITAPSGEGKSTLLNILSLLDEDYQGDIFLDGVSYKEIRDKESFRFDNFGFVFQNYSLFNLLSVEDNIILSHKATDKDYLHLKEVLKEVGLNVPLSKKVNLLSGGEKQRVAIARALFPSPKVMFCDEPTGNLNPSLKENVMEALKNISSSHLVIIVSHEINLLDKFCDNICYIKGHKIISRDGVKMVSKTVHVQKRENRLSFPYMLHYIFTHLKEKKYRSMISTSSISVGLVVIGMSLVLTSLVADSIKKSLFSLMDNDKYIMSIEDNSGELNETYASDKAVVEDIASFYKKSIEGVGAFYFSDFEEQFKDANYLSFTGGYYDITFGELNVRSINEYTWLGDIDESKILPSLDEELEDDEVVLKLRSRDIKRICDCLHLSGHGEKDLEAYLENNDLKFTFEFANSSWDYADEVFISSSHFIVSDSIGLVHSSPYWNEYIYEEIMHFRSSNDLISLDAIPWTFKKVYYLRTDREKQMDVLDKLLNNSLFDAMSFDLVNSENSYDVCDKNGKSGMIYVTEQRKHHLSFSEINEVTDNEHVESFIYSVPQSYIVLDSLMMHGFTSSTFVTADENSLIQIIDDYYLSEENITVRKVSVPDDMAFGGISDISSGENLKFQNQDTVKNLYGRKAEKSNEVFLSSRLAALLFPDKDMESLINARFYFLTIRDVTFDGTVYKNNFVQSELTITGINPDDNETNTMYSLPTWPIYYYAEYLNYTLSDLSVSAVLVDTDYDEVDEEILEELTEKYPTYEFSNPGLSFSSSIDNVVFYIDVGMMAFSGIATLSSVLMTTLVLYLFTAENKREIGLFKAIGISRGSIRILFVLFAFVLGLMAYAYSLLSLLISSLGVSYMLNGELLSFSLESFGVASLIMMGVIFAISLIIGFFSSEGALSYRVLEVLKEK